LEFRILPVFLLKQSILIAVVRIVVEEANDPSRLNTDDAFPFMKITYLLVFLIIIGLVFEDDRSFNINVIFLSVNILVICFVLQMKMMN
jgi:hypothetical protein